MVKKNTNKTVKFEKFIKKLKELNWQEEAWKVAQETMEIMKNERKNRTNTPALVKLNTLLQVRELVFNLNYSEIEQKTGGKKNGIKKNKSRR